MHIEYYDISQFFGLVRVASVECSPGNLRSRWRPVSTMRKRTGIHEDSLGDWHKGRV